MTGLTSLLIACAILWLLWLMLSKFQRLNSYRDSRNSRRNSRNRRPQHSRKNSQWTVSPSPTGKVRSATQRRLLVLLREDQRAAKRLLTQARLKHPGKSETWYWEKVIYDVERDRH